MARTEQSARMVNIMRQQSKVQIAVRGEIIGGPRPLICLPLVAQEKMALCSEAKELAELQPDLLEWRVDAYAEIGDVAGCLSTLHELRTIIGEIPLIFTCRIDREGGMQKMTQESRLALITRAIESGHVDIVDIEMCNEREFLESIRASAKAVGVKLMLSYHNFAETPDENILAGKLAEAEKMGGDIAKIAAMPKDYNDVLTLLSVTNRARNGQVSIPMVTISMGLTGKISRLAGGLFGSDITFGVGRESSAPGQIPFDDLKTGMALLYGD